MMFKFNLYIFPISVLHLSASLVVWLLFLAVSLSQSLLFTVAGYEDSNNKGTDDNGFCFCRVKDKIITHRAHTHTHLLPHPHSPTHTHADRQDSRSFACSGFILVFRISSFFLLAAHTARVDSFFFFLFQFFFVLCRACSSNALRLTIPTLVCCFGSSTLAFHHVWIIISLFCAVHTEWMRYSTVEWLGRKFRKYALLF